MSNVVWGFPNPQAILVEEPVKKYVINFSQEAALAPVINVLENTTGLTITPSRSSAGVYNLTFSANVPVNKFFLSGWSNYYGTFDELMWTPVLDINNTTVKGYLTVAPGASGPTTYGTLDIYTVDNTFAPVEYSALLGYNTFSIEMRIYP